MKSFNRIKKRSHYQNVRKSGDYVVTPLLIIQKSKNNYETPFFGITVSKKVSKKAVHRNKIKRKIREIIIQENRNSLIDSNDYVIIARPSSLESSYDEIRKCFNYGIKKF